MHALRKWLLAGLLVIVPVAITLAVLGWVMRKWSGELQAFQAWRDSQTADVQAGIARLPSADEPMADDVSPARRSPS